MKNKIIKLVGLGIILGVVMSIIQIIFKIDSKLFFSYYWKFSLLFLLLVVLINVVYFVIMAKKIDNMLKLYNEGRYQEYITEMEKILEKAKGTQLKNMIRINLSAGYLKNNEYEKSLNVLDSIVEKKLNNQQQLEFAYWNNKCETYFGLKDYQKFEEIYNLKLSLFEKFQDNDYHQQSVLELKLLNYIVKEQFEEARDLLQELRNKFSDSKNQKFYAEIEKNIELKTITKN